VTWSQPLKGVGLTRAMLEAHDCVIGVPDHGHVTRGLAPSPAFGPEVEDVMKIDVRERISAMTGSFSADMAGVTFVERPSSAILSA
jgi:hypothetical protein